MKKYNIKQREEKDCGAACLATIAEYYGIKNRYTYYQKITGTNQNGVNLYGLVDGGKQIGFVSEALKGCWEELLKGIKELEIHLPCILHMKYNHYIVLWKIKGRQAYISDPSYGYVKKDIEILKNEWSGYLVNYDNKCLTKNKYNSNETEDVIVGLFSIYGKRIIGIIALSILMIAISTMSTYIFQILIDGKTNIFSFNSIFFKNPINNIFTIMLLIFMLQSVFQFTKGFLCINIQKNINIDIYNKYINGLINIPLEVMEARTTGDLVTRADDINNFIEIFTEIILLVLFNPIIVLISSWMLLIANIHLFGIAILSVVIYTIIILAIKPYLYNLNYDIKENDSKIKTYIKEIAEGSETIKSCLSQIYVEEKGREKVHNYVKKIYKASKFNINIITVLDFVDNFSVILFLWIGSIMTQKNIITVGELMTFYVMYRYFSEAIKEIVDIQPKMEEFRVSIERINDVILEDNEKLNVGRSLKKIDEIEFKDVTFEYEYGRCVLDKISFSYKNGQKIAILGKSGSGKTTILKLILQFYKTYEGNILVNNQDIQSYKVNDIRNRISYVGQNGFLLSDSIYENIRLFDKNILESDIKEICKICGVDEFISKMPFGYNTILEERGNNLSQGQKQKIFLARALVRNFELLILDEATSNLDIESEKKIFEYINNIHSGCILITHKIENVKNFDKIVVLNDKGQISNESDTTFKEILC